MEFQYTMLRLNMKDHKTLGKRDWELVTIWPDTATEGIAVLKRREH